MAGTFLHYIQSVYPFYISFRNELAKFVNQHFIFPWEVNSAYQPWPKASVDKQNSPPSGR